MNKNYKKANDEENVKLNNYLLILIMTDYIFTYIGINHFKVILVLLSRYLYYFDAHKVDIFNVYGVCLIF